VTGTAVAKTIASGFADAAIVTQWWCWRADGREHLEPADVVVRDPVELVARADRRAGGGRGRHAGVSAFNWDTLAPRC
jgi:hypothetical protein